MKSRFSLIVLGIIAILCLMWACLSGVASLILAFVKDPLLWLPISGLGAGLVFAAIVKLEGFDK